MNDFIDLDRELLGTQYDESNAKKKSEETKDNYYLNVDTNRASSPYSRKVTDNTEFTKADSCIKLSENCKSG